MRLTTLRFSQRRKGNVWKKRPLKLEKWSALNPTMLQAQRYFRYELMRYDTLIKRMLPRGQTNGQEKRILLFYIKTFDKNNMTLFSLKTSIILCSHDFGEWEKNHTSTGAGQVSTFFSQNEGCVWKLAVSPQCAMVAQTNSLKIADDKRQWKWSTTCHHETTKEFNQDNTSSSVRVTKMTTPPSSGHSL